MREDGQETREIPGIVDSRLHAVLSPDGTLSFHVRLGSAQIELVVPAEHVASLVAGILGDGGHPSVPCGVGLDL